MSHDFDPDLGDDDVAVSAYVDGEATMEEARRVEADPALLARVAALRALGEMLASTPAQNPTEAEREGAIGAAVAAFETQRSSAEVPVAVPASVIPLDRRARRSGRRRSKLGPIALSVAAGLLVVAGVAALLRPRGDDASTVALGTAEARDKAADAAAGAALQPEALASSTTAASPASAAADSAGSAGQATTPAANRSARLPDLGAFIDVDDLVVAVATNAGKVVEAAPATTTPGNPAPSGPSTTIGLSAACISIDTVAVATLSGTKVLVRRSASTVAAPAKVTIVDATTCAVVAEFSR